MMDGARETRAAVRMTGSGVTAGMTRRRTTAARRRFTRHTLVSSPGPGGVDASLRAGGPWGPAFVWTGSGPHTGFTSGAATRWRVFQRNARASPSKQNTTRACECGSAAPSVHHDSSRSSLKR